MKQSNSVALKDSMQAAKQSMTQAKVEFELTTARLIHDFAMFKVKRAHDFKLILINFVNMQV
jgi:hypothetical protein